MASLLTLPSLSLSNPSASAAAAGAGAAPSLRLRAAFRCWALRRAGGGRWAAAGAIASPNSVLSEHAFKRLQLSDEEEEEEEGAYGSDEEGVEAVGGGEGDEDELAIARLGLPEQLVSTLEKRGITHLFPIQVMPICAPFRVLDSLTVLDVKLQVSVLGGDSEGIGVSVGFVGGMSSWWISLYWAIHDGACFDLKKKQWRDKCGMTRLVGKVRVVYAKLLLGYITWELNCETMEQVIAGSIIIFALHNIKIKFHITT